MPLRSTPQRSRSRSSRGRGSAYGEADVAALVEQKLQPSEKSEAKTHRSIEDETACVATTWREPLEQ